MQTDGSGNLSENVPISGDFVRVTFIEQGWDNSPSVRIQIQEDNGHVRQDPKVPLSSIGGVIGAVVNLLSETQR